ncbi:MAG: arsenical pump-driving ATPase GET3 [Anaerolineales bacterium]|nr:arsenical pump-driving ATPase GET3 [Anaerolineales bacterium]
MITTGFFEVIVAGVRAEMGSDACLHILLVGEFTSLPEVIEGNRFLAARAEVQVRYLDEIEARFNDMTQARLPLLDRDVSDLSTLRQVADVSYYLTDSRENRLSCLPTKQGRC